MSDYILTTNFGAKDDLTTGDPSKLVRGSEFQTEFEAVESAVASKANLAAPIFAGNITIDSDGPFHPEINMEAIGGYFKVWVERDSNNNKLKVSWDGTEIASIDESGNLLLAGTLTASTTP